MGINAGDAHAYHIYLDTHQLNPQTSFGQIEKISLLPLKDDERNRIISFEAPDIVDRKGTGISRNLRQSLLHHRRDVLITFVCHFNWHSFASSMDCRRSFWLPAGNPKSLAASASFNIPITSVNPFFWSIREGDIFFHIRFECLLSLFELIEVMFILVIFGIQWSG
jgi:hypothetical protein